MEIRGWPLTQTSINQTFINILLTFWWYHTHLDHNLIRSYETVFYELFLCGHYFIQYRFLQVYVFFLFLWKTSSFCLSAYFVFSACSALDVIFINFCSICVISIYIVGVRYSVFSSRLSLLTQTISKDRYQAIKTWLQLLIKSMPAGSFWVLKIISIKKNVEHLQNERL